MSHPTGTEELPPLANRYGVHNRVRFLKLSTSLTPRQGGHVLFSRGCHLFSSTSLEGTTAHTEATKSVQQASNESQQSPSLLNPKISLMRKAVFQNKTALDMITV